MDKIRLGRLYMVDLDENVADTWPGNDALGCQVRQVVVR